VNLFRKQTSLFGTSRAEDWARLIEDAVRQWLASGHVVADAGSSGTIVVDTDGDVAIVLAELYQSLVAEHSPATVAFRDGLRHAIRKCVDEWLGYKEFEALLGVVKKIDGCEFNQALLHAAQSKGFGALTAPQKASLFGLMLGILRQQPPTSPLSPLTNSDLSVTSSLTALCRIDTFPLQLVYRAFEVLVCGDPARVMDHLALLEVQLQRLRGQGKEFPKEWLANLRRFSAQFPSKDLIKSEGFGWANDWLFDDSKAIAATTVGHESITSRVRKQIERVNFGLFSRPSNPLTLSKKPPENWTARKESSKGTSAHA
jgi:hypothetical protein